MNSILHQDISDFASNCDFSNLLANSRFLITGATGLLGSTLIHCLLALNNDVEIVAPVRNINKSKAIFDESELNRIKIVECDLQTFNYSKLGSFDYIVHCASPTSSKYFVDYPVETFSTIVLGTKRLLDYAAHNSSKAFIYLSSLEVYGEISSDSNYITENDQGFLDITGIRSSYPMAKRSAENLCCLYAKEYGVPARIMRLTQTTGAGIANDDNRIIAQFARLVANNQDIVLHTNGKSARPYCYTIDAISALLYIMLRGTDGQAYNVANDETYISAYDMAVYLKDNFNKSISVRTEVNNYMGYAPTTLQRLSSRKVMALGWRPRYGLKEIFERLILYFNSTR